MSAGKYEKGTLFVYYYDKATYIVIGYSGYQYICQRIVTKKGIFENKVIRLKTLDFENKQYSKKVKISDIYIQDRYKKILESYVSFVNKYFLKSIIRTQCSHRPAVEWAAPQNEIKFFKNVSNQKG